jgi:hypothetical protein
MLSSRGSDRMNPVFPRYSVEMQVDPGELGDADSDNKGNDLPNDDEGMSGWMRFWHTASSNKPG